MKTCLFYKHFCVKNWFRSTPIIPRDAPVGHRRGNNPVEYVIFIFIPRDAPVGHRRGNNPVEYVIFFIFIFVTRSHKKRCRILIEV